MSYLQTPRLTFSGRFQADVSTVNNDVRHYDNALFEERFQHRQTTDDNGRLIENGWWRPDGTGAFRLVDVAVHGAEGPDGGADPTLVGLRVTGQPDRAAAKLVDLDPQFQMGSMIWGLQIVLTDGCEEYMRALVLETPFRDLYFGRIAGSAGSGSASAKFTTVLHGITWGARASRSPVLAALEASAATQDGLLSLNLMTHTYDADDTRTTFTLGRLAGTIGPWRRGDPKLFVLGRRFAPAPGGNPFASASGIGYFDVDLSEAGDAVVLDLGNALPLADRNSGVTDLGPLSLALLDVPDTVTPDDASGTVTPGLAEGATLAPGEFTALGPIDYRRPGWLDATAGIVRVPVPTGLTGLHERPLALVRPKPDGSADLLIRETYGGFFARADDFEKRIDARADGSVSTEVTLHAARYGRPLAGVTLAAGLVPPESDEGTGRTGTVDPPKAPVPVIGTPPAAMRFNTTATTGADGRAAFAIQATDPGSPRRYIDGQIYKIQYGFSGSGGSPLPIYDQIVIHLRDAVVVPDDPDWERDLVPILRQFANLYPIMSRRMFDIADEKAAAENARLLRFALGRAIDHPDHMPATRDLSSGKRQILMRWLDGIIGASAESLAQVAPATPRAAGPDLPMAAVAVPTPLSAAAKASIARVIEPDGGDKSLALRGLLIRGA